MSQVCEKCNQRIPGKQGRYKVVTTEEMSNEERNRIYNKRYYAKRKSKVDNESQDAHKE